MEDHIHIFSDLHPSISLAGYIKDIKVSGSVWMKGSGLFSNFQRLIPTFGRYGAFTYSTKEKNIIIDYVKNQKEHHKTDPPKAGL